MMNKIKLLITTAVLILLSACGGGGGSGSGGGVVTTPPVVVVDPIIKVYSTFNLANSILTGLSASDGVLQTCISPAKQIELMKYTYDPKTQLYTRYIFMLDGDFILPNASTCSTAGITGKTTGVNLVVDGNPVYALSSLSINADSFRYGTRTFWDNVLKQTGKIINSQSTSSQINCTDSAGKNWYIALNSIVDISAFFTTCAK